MENYKQASERGQEVIFKYIKSRMKEKKVTQKQLSEILQVSVTTLIRYFKKETQMPLGVYLEICDVLELNPCLIPKDLEKTLDLYVSGKQALNYSQCCKSDSEQLPNMTLEQAIAKAKPNLEKIKDVDKHLDDIR